MSRLVEYVPLYYRQSEVMQNLLQSEAVEADMLHDSQASVEAQFLLETATEKGLTRWEHILGLPDYTGNPLQLRRQRILARLRGMGTVTAGLIKSVAESYVSGAVQIIENPVGNRFTIKFLVERGIPVTISDLMEAIEWVKPAHLAAEYEYLYITWGEILGALTWGSILNASLTWGQLTSVEV